MDPLKIKIPPGTTEIDLRPALIPIVQHLIARARDLSKEDHGYNITPVDAKEFIDEAVKNYISKCRIIALRSNWIAAYLKANEWTYQETRRRHHTKYPELLFDYYVKRNYRENDCHISIPHDDGDERTRFTYLRSALISIHSYFLLDVMDIVTDIENFASPIEQLISEFEDA